ncbi:MAG: peptidoglycan DD-metalloendopeptidase family protein [Brevibacterium sp.]|uniref:M23 family metallopeptidase n=1 Tax=Brevibacterium sp. TaxID=1701 RepID=UPI00264A2DBF|nr:M23 family metallopeptidase [Brevibacterium sp.]MDN5833923.1 peptidoglycan DD-metalloendopeptidase family protein [Brevibacterium sp.]MDN5877677.1 peptidoglycan DD-metalloendopeptidase family protein [Brevibacterium sp.]MDN6134886.1 peptidoglycan DD-metalloendopeptidase family protein [Brevibacterium sp.]MDN6605387.1 peptidoglycan DD-metalloendopeptidase family protein [Brevibacterium sp.]MDN6747048.1 peptidoglycan DD-metalloendopeptidase family protein [Brevibacterium sp.]
MITAAVLAFILPVTSAGANPRDDKSKVDDRVKELQQEFEGLDEHLARVIAERDAAEEKLPDAEAASQRADDALAEAIEQDDAMAARLTSAQNAQKDLKTSIKDGAEEIEKHKTSAARIGRQAYQNSGITSDLAMLLQMAEGTSADGGIGRVDSAVRSQQRTIDNLSEQRAVNENNEERLSGVTDEISDLKDEAAEAVLAKEAAQVDAKKKADSLSDIISAKDDAEATISDNKAETEAQLKKEKEEQDRLAEKVREWEKEQEKKGKFVYGDGELANPAKGYPITSPFGYRIHPITGAKKLHSGTDFGVPCGTPIHAAGDGVVVGAGWTGGYGNRVVVSHGKIKGDSIASTYNHNTKVKVHAGQKVKKGDVISISGTTGASTGCHLHFEIMKNGGYVDPMPYIS